MISFSLYTYNIHELAVSFIEIKPLACEAAEGSGKTSSLASSVTWNALQHHWITYFRSMTWVIIVACHENLPK